MLNGIKNMINKKNNFLEAAALIYEDATNSELDDSIILGEDSDQDINEGENEDELYNVDDRIPNEEDNNGENDTDYQDPVDSEDHSSDNSEEELPSNSSDSDDNLDNDILNMDIDDSDELPDLVGRQTGEPADPSDDILNMEIDLHSNTPKDILPVPPAGASEVIPDTDDSTISQRPDSGFEDNEDNDNDNEDPRSILESPITEAISLSGDGSGTDSEGEVNTDSASSDDGSGDADMSSADNEDENIVTSAVKDKVSEMDTDVSDESGGGTPAGSAIIKKLSNITKNLEDVKKEIFDSIQ